MPEIATCRSVCRHSRIPTLTIAAD